MFGAHAGWSWAIILWKTSHSHGDRICRSRRSILPSSLTFDGEAPCPTDPSHLPGGRVICLLSPVILWLLESANPEAASLHSLAQSSLAAPTYQGGASSGSSLLFPRLGQDWPLGTKATWVEEAFSKQCGSKQAAKGCRLALRDRIKEGCGAQNFSRSRSWELKINVKKSSSELTNKAPFPQGFTLHSWKKQNPWQMVAMMPGCGEPRRLWSLSPTLMTH